MKNLLTLLFLLPQAPFSFSAPLSCDSDNKDLYSQNECYHLSFEGIFTHNQDYVRNIQEQHLVSKNISSLRFALEDLNSQVYEQMASLSVEDFLQRPSLISSLNRSGRFLKLEDFLDIGGLSPSAYEDEILQLAAQLKSEPISSQMARKVLLSYSEASDRVVMSKLVAIAILKGGYFYTELYRREKLAEIGRDIVRTQRKIAGLVTGSVGFRDLTRALANNRKKQAFYRLSRFSIESKINSLKLTLPLNYWPSFMKGVAYGKTLFSEGFHDRGNILKDGDIFLNITDYSEGGLYTKISGFPEFASHVGLIHKGYDESYPYYYITEYSKNWRGIYSLHKETAHRVYVRPTFDLPQDFSKKVLVNHDKLGVTHFDALLKEGVFNSEGEVSLYCGEYVHYAFQHQFDLKRGFVETSPLDHPGAITVSNHYSKMGAENFGKMGVNLAGSHFVPSQFAFSGYTEYVGHQFEVRGTPDSGEYHEYIYRLQTSRAFVTELAQHLSTFPLREITNEERKALGLFVKAIRIARGLSRDFPIFDVGLFDFAIPPGDQGFFLLKLSKLGLAYGQVWESAIAISHKTGEPLESVFERVYKDIIHPEFDGVFKLPN